MKSRQPGKHLSDESENHAQIRVDASIRTRDAHTVRGGSEALKTILIWISAASLLAAAAAAQPLTSSASEPTSGERATGPSTIVTYAAGTVL